MNIRFLGTSFGAPSVGRCQPSILIETDKYSYLFDVGAPVLDILVNSNYDLKKIKAIFITHLHGDHINGIFDILNLADYYQMNLSVYVPETVGIELFENYTLMQKNGHKSERISFELIKDGNFYDDGNLKVKSFPTVHMEAAGRKSLGFLMENGEKKICFTGDLSHSLEDFPKFLYSEFTDMIITECAHFAAESLFEKIKKCKTDMVSVIHVMPTEKYDDLIKCANNTEIKVVFPMDNDEYTI